MKNGLLCLPDYFSDITPSLKKEFESLIINHSTSRGMSAEQDGKVNIGHFSISNEGLADSDYVSLVAVNQYLTLLVSYYWGKQVYLAQAGGTRLEPSDIKENYRSMQWHHDTKHKQVKIFILLTDVLQDQQCTHFITGTHNLWHSSKDHGRRTNEFIQQLSKPIQLVGKAGTVWVLDTNGYHRGNRNNTVRRDMLVFNYTAGRYTYPMNFPQKQLKENRFSWLKTNNLKLV